MYNIINGRRPTNPRTQRNAAGCPAGRAPTLAPPGAREPRANLPLRSHQAMCRRMGSRQAPAISSPGPPSHIRGARDLYQGVCRPRNHPVSSSQTASAPTTTPLTSQPDSRILDAASPKEIDQQTPQEICLRNRIKPSTACSPRTRRCASACGSGFTRNIRSRSCSRRRRSRCGAGT
jgi:hypothetical protein